MDLVNNNTGDRESRRGKRKPQRFEPERMKREGLALLDKGKLLGAEFSEQVSYFLSLLNLRSLRDTH